jgi:hypothetical protein
VYRGQSLIDMELLAKLPPQIITIIAINLIISRAT